jgi:photosystem II stability/assembly factor-like uncharacterized protein
MKQIFVLFAGLFLLQSCTKSGSTLNNPAPTRDSLTAGWSFPQSDTTAYFDVFFINKDTGIAAGPNFLGRSFDGGLSWTSLPPQTSNSNLGMGSASHFTICYPFLNSTQDGGSTFKSINNATFYDCFYTNPNTCYAAGINQLYKSIDAGANWDTVSTFPTPDKNFRFIYFLNDSIGWMRSTGALYQTLDYGHTWSRIITSPGMPLQSLGIVQFLNPQVGVISDLGSGIGLTTDGGKSWKRILTIIGTDFSDAQFVTPQTGYVSYQKSIYRTSDGGASWQQVVRLATGTIIELHFIDENHGWAATSKGVLVYKP